MELTPHMVVYLSHQGPAKVTSSFGGTPQTPFLTAQPTPPPITTRSQIYSTPPRRKIRISGETKEMENSSRGMGKYLPKARIR
jgi:hypothetical protein